MRYFKIILIMVLFAVTFVSSINAEWIDNGVPVCTAILNQNVIRSIPDGSGGAIIVWRDYRPGSNYDLYIQHINAAGELLWTADGVAVCTGTGSTYDLDITSDGDGGAIVTWEDSRSVDYDIYAQRIDKWGNTKWTTNGVTICTSTSTQADPKLVYDGSGGAIIVWEDYRSGTSYDIYAQRVNSSGTVQWPANGIGVCTASGTQQDVQITSDGTGGAIVAWEDFRSGTSYDIYAQRISKTGTYIWAGAGAAVCDDPAQQYNPQLVSDGNEGAVITWYDSRNGTYDIYAQRIGALGYAQWTTDGNPVCTTIGAQSEPRIAAVGSGVSVIVWIDSRNGTDNNIYAQKIDSAGIPKWTANGAAICTASDNQYSAHIMSDGMGGAFITWEDYRSGDYDIYGQRIDTGGTVKWMGNGIAICSSSSNQYNQPIVSDGAGGFISAWQDFRTGDYCDVYAQAVDAQGRFGFMKPEIQAVRDVPGDQGGYVYLGWHACRYDITRQPTMSYYSIWRAINLPQATAALENGALMFDRVPPLDVDNSQPVIRMQKAGPAVYFWELIATQDAYNLEGYGKQLPTMFDSTAVSTEYHLFQLIAHTTDPSMFWISEPDSGYSVDNLSPAPPTSFMGTQVISPEGLSLIWDANHENDLDGYVLYRGPSETFIPDEDSWIAATSDTTLFDGEWTWDSGYYYKICAIDIHGNESLFSLLSPENVTGTETSAPPANNFLAQNVPNPFNPMTRIAFGIEHDGNVSLKIYDVTGRLLRVLVDEWRERNQYETLWDGCDDNGNTVGSGIYFMTLVTADFTQTRKMVLTK